MNKKIFYDNIRDNFTLTNTNVAGFDFILDEAEKRGIQLDYLAYILATTWHETAATMQPIREYGKGKGRKYGKPTGKYNNVYYGRGYVQLTWDYNYEKAAKKLGVDFYRYPDKVMEPRYAVEILFVGMLEGWFTGKALKDYIDGLDEPDSEDLREFTNARRIINGTDKQVKIGKEALIFEKALRKAGYGTVKTVEEVKEPSAPVDYPVEQPEETVQEIPEEKGTDLPEKEKSSGGLLYAILAGIGTLIAYFLQQLSGG